MTETAGNDGVDAPFSLRHAGVSKATTAMMGAIRDRANRKGSILPFGPIGKSPFSQALRRMNEIIVSVFLKGCKNFFVQVRLSEWIRQVARFQVGRDICKKAG